MDKKAAHLTDGSNWIDHEDCLIGDEVGLQNLIRACEIAIEKGHYYGEGLGDYTGVKKLDVEFFDDPKDSVQTRFANSMLGIVLVLLILLILIGLGTVIKWIF